MKHHEQSDADAPRRSRRTPRAQRMEGQRRKYASEENAIQQTQPQQAPVTDANQPSETIEVLGSVLTAAARADSERVKVIEPEVPAVTIPDTAAVAAALCASAQLTEHKVAEVPDVSSEILLPATALDQAPTVLATTAVSSLPATQASDVVVKDDAPIMDADTTPKEDPLPPVATILPESSQVQSEVVVAPQVVAMTAEITAAICAKPHGVLSRARSASAPMAIPAEVPAVAIVHHITDTPPLVRAKVEHSGRHGGSSAAHNVAVSQPTTP